MYLDKEQQKEQNAAKKKLNLLVDKYTNGKIKAHRFIEKAVCIMMDGYFLSGWSEHDASIELAEMYKSMNNLADEIQRKVYWGE